MLNGRAVINEPDEVRRTLSASTLNEIANHPEVRPWLGGKGLLDMSEAVANPANFALEVEGGGFVLIRHEQAVYEVHSLFLPEARRRSRDAMRSGMEYMFTRTDCEQILTKVPDANRAAAMLATLGGFRRHFHRADGFDGQGCSYLSVQIQDWAMACPELEIDGEWFHRGLEAAKEAAGSSLLTHEHDEAHERAVGAAIRMVRAGNPVKGIAFYNRWALFAGYAPLSILTLVPLVIDVVDAIIEVRDREMEFLLCR